MYKLYELRKAYLTKIYNLSKRNMRTLCIIQVLLYKSMLYRLVCSYS